MSKPVATASSRSRAKTSDVAASTIDRYRFLSQIIAWFTFAMVSLLAILAWAQSNAWHIFPFSSYQFFPVLGLLAFSIMWSHYLASFIRQKLRVDRSALAQYFSTTSFLVLALICLHPGILIYQRLHDGYGLPPHSYETYVAPSKAWITLLGSVSLLIFIAYEFHRIYAKKSWWHYVQSASDIAMLLIFYHGLELGSQLQQGWFRIVWFLYGISLIGMLVYSYGQKLWPPKQLSTKKPAQN